MAVDDVIRESMSAVMDGEASEMDLARVLKAVESSSDARAYWQRLQGAQTLLKTGAMPLSIYISEGVLANVSSAHGGRRQPGPLTSLAVAASVTLAVVFGGQQLLQTNDANLPIAQVPGGVMTVQGGTPVQARYGAPPQMQAVAPTPTVNVAGRSSTNKVYEQLARERFERYGFEHAHQTAALQPNSLVPFARVPTIRAHSPSP